METLINFRDLGGKKTSNKSKLKTKRLLRAAQPVGLSQNDINKLKQHNLKLIIDLRTSQEAAMHPVDQIEGVSYINIDIMGANKAQSADPTHWMKMLESDINAVEQQFKETYIEFALSENSRKGYGDFLRACASLEEGAILFHCAAGKDRTGLAAAIILRILGIDDDDIYEDYLKTMEAQDAIAAPYMAKARAGGVPEAQLEAMKVLMSVKHEFLAAALNAAAEEYGSFESYIIDGLGLNQEELEKIRELYLEK